MTKYTQRTTTVALCEMHRDDPSFRRVHQHWDPPNTHLRSVRCHGDLSKVAVITGPACSYPGCDERNVRTLFELTYVFISTQVTLSELDA